jgi:predicted nucleotidyltransferase
VDFGESLKKALDLLIEKVNPVTIYLFGSAARDELREDSDIDIAYLSDACLSAYENFMFAQELADIFKRDVDLIDLKQASTVFKAQVVGMGKRIYCSDENRRMYFEMRAFKEYALLNEERAVILEGIRERGSVYGK